MFKDIRKTKVSKIAYGVHGIVYKTISPETGKYYAVKRNKSDEDISFIGCLKEIDFLYKLKNHPNIINVIGYYFSDDVFKDDQFSPLNGKSNEYNRNDNVHFLLEYADLTLTDLIKQSKYRTADIYLSLMTDILLGLEYLHRQNILHRDVKPQNILIKQESSFSFVAKLCDFGLSSILTSQEKNTPGVITPLYKPPEILLQLGYDLKADIWSVGCVFIEMFSKHPLIKCKNSNDINILNEILSYMPNTPPIKDLESYLDHENINYLRKNVYKISNNFLGLLKLSNDEKIKFSKSFDLKLLANLLSKMFSFYPKKRFSVYDCLNHPFFDNKEHKISKLLSYDFNIIDKNPRIIFIDCIEREWFFTYILSVFNKRHELSSEFDWYSNRILFHSIEIFDRYILKKYNNMSTTEKKYIPDKQDCGKIHKKIDIRMRFYIILYLNIKYFRSFHDFPRFDTFVSDDKVKKNGYLVFSEDFEMGLIYDYLNYDIYHHTLYEAADDFDVPLNDTDISNLLYIYGNNKSINGLTIKNIMECYIKNRENSNIKNHNFQKK